MDSPSQIPPQAEGPLRALIEALRERRPLFFTGDVLVQLAAELGDQVADGQATMVLDAEDLGSIEQLLGPERKCRECGCTATNACVFPGSRTYSEETGPEGQPTTCHWIAEDLCSACGPQPDPETAARWIHPGDRAAA